jgi:two-component system, NtrC family, sensor kinase
MNDINADPIAQTEVCVAEDGFDVRIAALEDLADGIWIVDPNLELLFHNRTAKAMERMFWSSHGRVGTMYEVVFDRFPREQVQQDGHWSQEFHLGDDADHQYSVMLQVRALFDGSREFAGFSCHARDISREWRREQALQDRNVEIEAAYSQLRQTQTQLLQSEKMASIGQLAAGVAHEINNPIGYVHSNLGSLQSYVRNLFTLLQAFDEVTQQLAGAPDAPALAVVEDLKRRLDYDFLVQDLPQLLSESREGIERVKKIVSDLRDFSHGGNADEWLQADLHRGLDSAINIVWNDLKYKARVHREFAPDLPQILCLPSQLNQVFLNLLVNAGQAISSKGEIRIVTGHTDDELFVQVSDNGCGIAPDNLKRIFDPFFTTKAVGTGTGLGLALSYGIVQKHNGRIEVHSELGVGTRFTVWLPRQQPDTTQPQPQLGAMS